MIAAKKQIRIVARKMPMVFAGGVAVCDEDDLCMVCVRWFDRTFGPERRFDLIHIPNEGRRTRWEAKRLLEMGLRAGTPDYLVQKNGVPVGWMEFKFGKNNLRQTQKEFKNYCETGGFEYAVVKSFDEFKSTLRTWGIFEPETQKQDHTLPIMGDFYEG